MSCFEARKLLADACNNPNLYQRRTEHRTFTPPPPPALETATQSTTVPFAMFRLREPNLCAPSSLDTMAPFLHHATRAMQLQSIIGCELRGTLPVSEAVEELRQLVETTWPLHSRVYAVCVSAALNVEAEMIVSLAAKAART